MEAYALDHKFTSEDYDSWDEDVRCELINGVVYNLAAPMEDHQSICVELCTQLHTYLRKKTCRVFTAPYAVYLTPNTVVEPDLVIVCDPSKRTRRGCQGAPDMVVEVVSPSSMRMDLRTKMDLYLKAGIREYWLVYPEPHIVQVYLLTEGKYVSTAYGPDGFIPVSVLEDCKVDLSLVFPEE